MEVNRSNLDVRMKSLFVEQYRTSSLMSHTKHLHADLLPRNLHRESSTHRPSPLQCRLSFHCCCYCCPQLEALLDAPCASLILPAVRRLHLSFRFRVPKLRFASGGGSSGGGAGGGANGNGRPLLLLLPSW